MRKLVEVIGWVLAVLAAAGICREAFFSAQPAFSLIAGLTALLVLGATTASALHINRRGESIKTGGNSSDNGNSNNGSIELLKSPILWLGVPMVLVMVWGFLR